MTGNLDEADYQQNGNAEVMRFIRSHVRSAFDKAFEDAIGFFFKSTITDADARRWNSILSAHQYRMTGEEFSVLYEEYVAAYDKYNDSSTGKARCLILLEQAYAGFPD